MKHIITAACILLLNFNLSAQAPPPMNSGNYTSQGTNALGSSSSGAPIGDGTLFFMLLSLAYTVRIPLRPGLKKEKS